MKTAPERLLIIRKRYLGDLVLLDPVLRSLRETYPSLFLTLLVDEGYASVLATHPAVNRIIELPRRRPHESLFSFVRRSIRVGLELRKLRCDTVVDCQPTFATVALTRLAGIPRRIGFASADEKPKHRINVPVPISDAALKSQHVIRSLFVLFEPLKIPFKEGCRFEIPDAEEREARKLLNRLVDTSKPLVLVHPGARLPARRWPAASFAAAIAALKKDGRAEVLLIQGGGEEDLVRAIAGLVPGGVAHLVEPLPLVRFAAVARRAAAYLGNDTGPMHVAAASGTRVVALFGAQSVTMWKPIGSKDRYPIVLQPSLPCGDACLSPDRCVPEDSYRMYCIGRIPVDEVVAAVLRSLDEHAGAADGN